MIRHYCDTEFNGYGGVLIALALVRDENHFIYLLNGDLYDLENEIDPWVAKNVLTILHEVPDHVEPVIAPLEEWGGLISDYLSHDKEPSQIIADWPSDIADLCNLLLTGPGTAVPMPHQMHFTILRHLDVYPTSLEGAVQHNAWWDAMALKRWVDEVENRV